MTVQFEVPTGGWEQNNYSVVLFVSGTSLLVLKIDGLGR